MNESAASEHDQLSYVPSIKDPSVYRANAAAIDRLVGPSRFVYIIAWGKWLGFKPVTVQDLVRQAEADNAPLESIQKVDGRWLVLDDIVNDNNRDRVKQMTESPERGWLR